MAPPGKVKGRERLAWSWSCYLFPRVSLLAWTVHLFTAKRLQSAAQTSELSGQVAVKKLFRAAGPVQPLPVAQATGAQANPRRSGPKGRYNQACVGPSGLEGSGRIRPGPVGPGRGCAGPSALGSECGGIARCDGRSAAWCTAVTAPDREAVTRHSQSRRASRQRDGQPLRMGPSTEQISQRRPARSYPAFHLPRLRHVIQGVVFQDGLRLDQDAAQLKR